ncbi:PAS domain-containing protein [Sorangium sp. So ce260]|uniref:PAS domain-containing protein n=1 Tax=Sorangium sp. So ce260 TaxID=3133291 RepID=UPI003F5F6078
MTTAAEGREENLYVDPRLLVETLDDPALVIDARGAIRCKNEQLDRLLAAPGAPILPLSPEGDRVLLPPAPAAADVAWLVALLSGESDRAEVDLPGEGSGAPRWAVRGLSCAIGGGRGALLRFIDLGERRAREHQRRCAQVIESMQLGCTFLALEAAEDDRSLRYVYMNPAAERLASRPVAEIIGQTMDEIVPSLREMGVPQRLAGLIRSRLTAEGEMLLPLEEGSRVITSSAFPVGDQCVAVIYDDITERRATEESLERTRILLDVIIDNLPLLLFVKDEAELRYVRVNRSFEEFHGHARGELLGKRVADYLPEAPAAMIDAECRAVLAGGVPVEIPETRIISSRLGERIGHVRWIPMADAHGKGRYLLGLIEDITERKKIEDAKRHEAILLETQRRLLDLIQELSTPSIPIHPGILVVPLIGQMESSRGAQLMESIVRAIERHRAEFVIIDITGVTSVDSAVASHLLQATRAAGLLGAECSVVGASPGIARTVIDLGIELGKITTHRDLEAGFRHALARKGYVIAPRAARRAGGAARRAR